MSQQFWHGRVGCCVVRCWLFLLAIGVFQQDNVSLAEDRVVYATKPDDFLVGDRSVTTKSTGKVVTFDWSINKVTQFESTKEIFLITSRTIHCYERNYDRWYLVFRLEEPDLVITDWLCSSGERKYYEVYKQTTADTHKPITVFAGLVGFGDRSQLGGIFIQCSWFLNESQSWTFADCEFPTRNDEEDKSLLIIWFETDPEERAYQRDAFVFYFSSERLVRLIET